MAKLSVVQMDTLAKQAAEAFIEANQGRIDLSEIAYNRLSLKDDDLDVTLYFDPKHDGYSPFDNALLVSRSALALWKQQKKAGSTEAKWLKSLKWDDALVVAERALNKIKEGVSNAQTQ